MFFFFFFFEKQWHFLPTVGRARALDGKSMGQIRTNSWELR